MAEASQNRVLWIVAAALCLGTCTVAVPQSQPAATRPPRLVQLHSLPTGSLTGRLTDLHSAPLAGITVVLRSQVTGTQVRVTTGKNGAFRFPALNAGAYTLDADGGPLGHSHLDGIVVTGGAEARVQAAIQFKAAAPNLLEATAPPITDAPVLEAATPPVTAVPILKAAALPVQHAEKPAVEGGGGFNPRNRPTESTRPSGPDGNLPEVSSSVPHFSAAGLAPVSAPVTAAPVLESTAAAKPSVSPITPPVTQVDARVLNSLHPRAPLQTQSLLIEPALATNPPRALLLAVAFPARLAAHVAAARFLHAAVSNLSWMSAIEAASQRPDPSTPATSTTMTAEQIEQLPASGRRWQEFLLEAPAANATADSSQLSFRGAQESAEVTIDGDPTRLAFGVAAGSQNSSHSAQDTDSQEELTGSNSRAWMGGRGFGVSEAAIREVTTVAGNAGPEGMRSSGGLTSIRTASGSNTLHGQGFLFDRQNNWGARNPFTQWLQNTGTAAAPAFATSPFTPPDHEMVWGIGAGSDIRRNKLFWFAALNSNHRNDPGLAAVRNPTEFFNLPERTSPTVTLLSAQFGESANQAYNDYLGVTSSGYAPAGLEQLAALLGPAPRTSAHWQGFVRIDWRASERQHFTLEGAATDSHSIGGGSARVSATYGNHSFGSTQSADQRLLGRWEAYLTPNLLAVTQGSVGRQIASATPSKPSPFEQSFLAGNFWGQLPQIVVDSRYGFTIGNPSRFGQGNYPDERLYHGQETLNWAHDLLLVRAGIELDHNADATSLLRNQTGTYHYSTVASFISDALAFQKFGLANALDPRNPHNCGASSTKFGSQPCYSYYTQTMGPNDWRLSTNDWAGFVSAQWQPAKIAVLSAGLRWELQQLPPPLASLANPDLPLTVKLPALGSNWGPRVSLALGSSKSSSPILRFGYGMYYGRLKNATIETALTQTGSLRGDLSFFMRPSDDCQFCAGGSPPFPYVFAGQPSSAVKPGAVEFAPNFRNSEVHQAVAAVEETLPGRVEFTASAMLSLARRLPVSIDTNFDPAFNPQTITYNIKDPTGKGPIKSTQITVPFYASWPFATSPTGTAGRLNLNYQQIAEIMSRANSTYEALAIRFTREGRRGLSLHAHYTYAHAMDWNPNESTLVAGSDPLDPANFSQEYGASNLDVRHSAAVTAILASPLKLRDLAGRIANGWALSGIGQFRSGMPYTMRTSGSLPEEFTNTGAAIAGLGPGMNGSGGDNRVYGVGRNTFRYPATWKADLRLAKRFELGEMRQLELIAETFNLFNHQNVTQIETSGYAIENGGASGTLPTLCFLTINTNGYAGCGTAATIGTGTPLPAFGRPLNINATDFYRERQIEFGVRMKF